MPTALASRRRPPIPSTIWPGFVDALVGVLLVLIFAISTFIIVQFLLRDELAGQSQSIRNLETRLTETATLLTAEQARALELANALEAATEGMAELEALLAAESEALGAETARATGLEAALADVQRVSEAQSGELDKARESIDSLVAQLGELEAAAARLTRRIENEVAARLELEGVLGESRRSLGTAEAALARALEAERAALAAAERLEVELRQETETVREQLLAEAAAEREARERAEAALADARAEADRIRDTLTANLENERLAKLAAERLLDAQQKIAESDRERLGDLTGQTAALRRQLQYLQAQLEDAEERDRRNEVTIHNLGTRLNAALAQRVGELSRYRSEFFGQMREALGDREDIRIVGDRFVFESGLLFATASAEIGDGGKRDLAQIARAIRDIAELVPPEIPWLIRVDGHTDQRPLRPNPQFSDNWELSQARALAVVRFFVEEYRLPPDRFAAAGFGSHQPIDEGDSDTAHARNRRMELQLTQR